MVRTNICFTTILAACLIMLCTLATPTPAQTFYKISGHILKLDGTPVQGVTVELRFTGISTTTDANGYYEVNAPEGWTGWVEPTKTEYLFTPSDKKYTNVTSDQLDQDYTALEAYSISGYVRTPDGMAVWTWVAASNGGGATLTDSNGYYKLMVPRGWSGTINPLIEDYFVFDPQSITHTNVTSDIEEQNFTALICPTISGYVHNQLGVAVIGMTVSASNGVKSVLTNDKGYYKLYVPSGWNGTVTPGGDSQCSFNPQTMSYSNVTSDQSDQNYVMTGRFTDIDASLPGLGDGSLAWGDYDNDGDLDLAITGSDPYQKPISKIYSNNNGTFMYIDAGLTQVSGSIAWGDYDIDGDLDLALTGYDGNDNISKIYKNVNGAFIDIDAGLIPVNGSSLAWGDYNNDGDMDIVLTGFHYSSYANFYKCTLYSNNKGTFTDTGVGFADVISSSLAWGDYDNDGDLDLALAGWTGSDYISKIYQNRNGTFTDIGAGLTGVSKCSLAWGDYDNDGDLDLSIAGESGSSVLERISKIYRNDYGTFVDINAGLIGVSLGSLAWGDYDNDGDLDLALSGEHYDGNLHSRIFISKIYRNTNGIFTDIGAGLPGLFNCSLAWGDYDNDGDLDIALAGELHINIYPRPSVCKIYRNDGDVFNSAPDSPSGLMVSSSGSDTIFSWSAANDAETTVSGLAYNLRVGTAPGLDDIFSGMANSSTGLRLLPSIGNAQKSLSWTLEGLGADRAYYWSVQSIDTAFAGSKWADEKVIAPYTVSGKIVLGDFKGDITKVPINVKMSKQGGTATNVKMNLRSDGSFTLGVIEPGTYDITFKANNWLSKTVRNVVIE